MTTFSVEKGRILWLFRARLGRVGGSHTEEQRAGLSFGLNTLGNANWEQFNEMIWKWWLISD